MQERPKHKATHVLQRRRQALLMVEAQCTKLSSVEGSAPNWTCSSTQKQRSSIAQFVTRRIIGETKKKTRRTILAALCLTNTASPQ
eukprot:2641810-Amphidinium_carterae.1